jgi:transposase
MRYDLTDFEWSVIEPVLPRGGVAGSRRIIDGS